jgi:hypothetical protein
MQYIIPTHWQTSTSLHGVTFQKIVLFIVTAVSKGELLLFAKDLFLNNIGAVMKLHGVEV